MLMVFSKNLHYIHANDDDDDDEYDNNVVIVIIITSPNRRHIHGHQHNVSLRCSYH